MATESRCGTIAGAHPYWAYPFSDVAVYANGQLTKYHSGGGGWALGHPGCQ